MVVLKRLLPRKTYKFLEALAIQLVMLAVVIPFFFIFFYMFWNSLKPDYLFFEPGTWIFEPLWSNYVDVYEQSELFTNIGNSLIISGSATLIGLFCGILPAYTIARYNMRRLAMAILFTRMVPYLNRASAVLDCLQIRRITQHAHWYYSGASRHHDSIRRLDYDGIYRRYSERTGRSRPGLTAQPVLRLLFEWYYR